MLPRMLDEFDLLFIEGRKIDPSFRFYQDAIDYIIELRLGAAARMLIDSTKMVAEICYDCGFNTLSNFNRLFRKHKGCTPTAFRENFNKKKLII